MRKSLFAVLLILLSACAKELVNEPQIAQFSSISNERAALQNFSIALSQVVCENEEVRELLKNESLKQFDKDYDVLYQLVKDKLISNKGSFRDLLASKFSDNNSLYTIEQMIPGLTIYVSDISWLVSDGFCAKNWDTSDEKAVVTFREDNGICTELYSNGYYLGEIEEGTIPGGAVLIVKKNERIIANVNTKSGEFQYSFVDDAYNGQIFTKSPRHIGPYDCGWIPGQPKEDDSNNMSIQLINSYNPNIISAFEFCRNNPYALQNDYLFYGMTNSNTYGRLRTDVRPKLIRFKISPCAIKGLFDNSDDIGKDTVESWDTDDNGKGPQYEPSIQEIYSALWSEGSLEIQMRTITGSENGSQPNINTDYYDVRITDLFTIKDHAIKREQWGANWRKWYITWLYSLPSRDETTFESKWYYKMSLI